MVDHLQGDDPLDDPLDDVLEELRGAWASLEAPAPADDLGETDPRTRQVVEWMREAWSTLEPETTPTWHRPAPILRPAFRPEVLPRLAAAALVAGLVALLWWGRQGDATIPDSSPDEGPMMAAGGNPRPEEQRAPEPERVPERSVQAHGVQFASLSSEKIEMRSGSVRLVLLTGPGTMAGESAGQEPTEEYR